LSNEDHRLWKIVLLGDGAVGKTSLRKTYLGEGFETDYLSTMGADFALYDTTVDNTHIRWQIWDLAGQPVFKDVVKAYYTKVFGGLIVYDVTRPKTFDNIDAIIICIPLSCSIPIFCSIEVGPPQRMTLRSYRSIR